MQTKGKLFDDVAKVANSAAGVFSGFKGEIEGLVKDRIERMMVEMDLVTREEFDAVQAMAAKARQEQEKLAERVETLEAEVASLKKPAAKKTTAKKVAAKKASSD
ncbi:accessory factor UbiK family protein [Curvivirga aplysinae]|uniref:accessory factor UbiK family protein n=1 Tax=Curvivirga aplysinae TaxID=2529852 RepID=UPI0012BBB907|nr:accessory factor UbiK family protein [Curvivirga aplysinae]MTI08971.1 accessory factor UbiK family protein [Curvivirga aplysinae]